MGATGTATIDFGTGSQRAVATITGQGSILSNSLVEAFFMADTSVDHSDYDHQMVAMVATFCCGNIAVATGFDAVCVSEVRLRGIWSFHWVWN